MYSSLKQVIIVLNLLLLLCTNQHNLRKYIILRKNGQGRISVHRQRLFTYQRSRRHLPCRCLVNLIGTTRLLYFISNIFKCISLQRRICIVL